MPKAVRCSAGRRGGGFVWRYFFNESEIPTKSASRISSSQVNGSIEVAGELAAANKSSVAAAVEVRAERYADMVVSSFSGRGGGVNARGFGLFHLRHPNRFGAAGEA